MTALSLYLMKLTIDGKIILNKDEGEVFDFTKNFSYKVVQKISYESKDYRTGKSRRLTREVEVLERLYVKTKRGYEFSKGFGYLILNQTSAYLDQDSITRLKDELSFSLNITDWWNLPDRPDQLDATKSMIRWKKALIGCYTAFGKSQIIAVLTKALLESGKTVLILAPNTSSVSNIIDRLRKFGIEISDHWRESAQINCINPVAFVNSNKWDTTKSRDFPFIRRTYAVLSDEVECTLHDSFLRIDKRLDSAEVFWGFSASANKKSLKDIPRTSDLLKMMNSQIRRLVKYYGFTCYSAKPAHLDVTIHTIHTKLFALSTSYSEIVQELFGNLRFKIAIHSILQQVPSLFIPVNNHNAIKKLIIAGLIQDPILVIDGGGYKEYKDGKYFRTLSYKTMMLKISENYFKLILGTSSSFRALDFSTITNVLVTFGRSTSVVIQYVGRVARESKLDLWFIQSNRKVRGYSNAVEANQKLVAEQYSDCTLNYDEQWI